MSRRQRRYLLFVSILLAIELLLPLCVGVDVEEIRLLRDRVYRGETTLPNYLPHAYNWHMPTEFAQRLFLAYIQPISILNFIVAMVIVLKYRHSTIITLLQDLRLTPETYQCAMRILFPRFSLGLLCALLLTPHIIAVYLGAFYGTPFFYLPYLWSQAGLGFLILLTDRVHVAATAAGSGGWPWFSVFVVSALVTIVFSTSSTPLAMASIEFIVAVEILLLVPLIFKEIKRQVRKLGQPQEISPSVHP